MDASGKETKKGAAPAVTANSGYAQLQMLQNQAMASAVLQQKAAYTRKARRMHVSNLPPEITKEALLELFNTTMHAAKLAADEASCINDVHMAPDGRYAFLEFRSVMECSNAMMLDGIEILGRAMRVKRPNDYAPPPAGMESALIPQHISAAVTSSTLPPGMAIPGGSACGLGGLGGLLGGASAPIPGMAGVAPANSTALSSVLSAATLQKIMPQPGASLAGLSGASLAAMSVPGALGAGGQANALGLTRRARRLHIGNLPLGVGLTTDMIKQFFDAALVSANLHDTSKDGKPVLEATINAEGKFGFVEFRTIAEATSAMALNNIELGGKQMRIERPRDYAPMPDNMLDDLRAAGVLGNTSVAPDGKDLLAPEPATAQIDTSSWPALKGPEAPAPLEPLNLESPTPVLVLQNMVSLRDTAQEQEMADILEDTKIECEKHGPVTACISPRHGAGGVEGSGLEAEGIWLRVFVRFETAEAAVACAKELHNKAFDGKAVAASFFEESMFTALQSLPCFV